MSRLDFSFPVPVLFLACLVFHISGCEGQTDPITMDSGGELAGDGDGWFDHSADQSPVDVIIPSETADTPLEAVADIDTFELDMGPPSGEAGAPCNSLEECNSGF